MRVLIFLMALAWAIPASALEMVRVANDVYAIVGDLSQRSPSNFGNNATFGAVLTNDGVVLIDPGGSAKGAAQIETALKSVTDKPVKLVINTGGQDHRWLGNGYFKAKGAKIIASTAAVEDQRDRSDIQFQGLEFLIGKENLTGTEAVYADQIFDEKLDLDWGGVRFELHASGGAHTPGDAFVWLADRGVMFTGDIVYLERMLAVLDVSDSAAWVDAFNAIAAYEPKVIVAGHGHPNDLAKAKKQTLDYLVNVRTKVRAVLDRGGLIADGTAVDQNAFKDLFNFEQLARRNAQAVFIEMEFD